MTDDVSKQLKEALGRLGIRLDTPEVRQRDVFTELREAAAMYEQNPVYQQEREYRQMYAELRRLEEQTEAAGRMIEEHARRMELERNWDAALRTWQDQARLDEAAQRHRFTGRPFRGTHSRLIDLKEPAQHTPRPRQKGTVALNEATVRAELAASLARLGIHTSQEEETL